MKKDKELEKRLERIEIAILDLAEFVQNGEWKDVYQHIGKTIHPINERL